MFISISLSRRQKAKKILQKLNFNFTNRSTIIDLITHLEKTTDKKIKILFAKLPLTTHGGWFSIITDDGYIVEHIFINDMLSPLQQIHTILHELSHIIRGDKTWCGTLNELFMEKERLIKLMLYRRLNGSNEQELDAEAMALVIHDSMTK